RSSGWARRTSTPTSTRRRWKDCDSPGPPFVPRGSCRRSTSGRDACAAACSSTSRTVRRSSRSWRGWRSSPSRGGSRPAASAGSDRPTSSSGAGCRSTSYWAPTRSVARSSAAGRCARSSTPGPPTSRGGGGDAAASSPTADGRGRRAARASVREQSREEVLHARAEGVRTLLDAAALEVLPRALGRRRGRLARLLEFLAGELRALDDGVADALGRLLHARTDLAVPDLLGASLDLTRRRLHFRLIRGDDRRRRPADDGDRRERDRQQSLGVHDAISLLTSR